MNMGKRSEIMTAEPVGPGVGLRTGGAKNHRPFNVFLAQPNSNPVSRSYFMAFKPSVYAGLEVFDSGNQPDETSDAERPAPLSGSEPFPKAEGCGSVDGRISIRIVFT